MSKKVELPPNVIDFTEDYNGLVEAVKKIGEDKLVIVEFFATWCGPCRRLNAALPNIAKENSTVTFYKVDIDRNKELTDFMQIRSSVPDVLFYKLKDGKLNKLDEMHQCDIGKFKSKIEALKL